MKVNNIIFPQFMGVSCYMMPIIQGDSKSLPEAFKQYSEIVENNFLDKGKIGFLTIDERFVTAGTSQRGYGEGKRHIHMEVGRRGDVSNWGNGNGYWGDRLNVIVDSNTEVLIANSISNTCRYWDAVELSDSPNGDLSHLSHIYTEDSGITMQGGDMVKMSVFTPHEPIKQKEDGNRQFFRIVGHGVHGTDERFTKNPLVSI